MHDEHESEALDPRTLWFGAAGIFLMAAIPRIARAWESVPDLLLRSTWDDTFYYFGIARNIMDGNGASFDGENITNGFHPLWLALITPFWAFGGDTPIHLALTLGAIFGAATAALAFLIVARATSSLAASFVGGAFFALHPAIISDSVNGMESSVTVFMLAAVMYAALLIEDMPKRTSWPADVAFGGLCGGLLLARTDMIFVIAALLIYLAIRWRSAAVKRLAVIGATVIAVVAPWLAWSYAATGSILQVSGRAGGLLERQRFDADGGEGLEARLRHGASLTRDMLSRDVPRSYFVPSDVPEALGVAAIVVLAAVITWTAWRTPGCYRRAALVLGVVTTALLALFAYHAGIRLFTRTWYFTPGALVVACAIGMVCNSLERAIAANGTRLPVALVRRSSAAVVVVAALVFVVVYQPHDTMGWAGTHPHELTMYEGARWLREETPPDTRAGSFNGGIIGYFSDRAVLNLDGVVNENAYEALRGCEMTTYIRDERIEYVVDFGNAVILASCGEPVVTFEDIAQLGPPGGVFGQIHVLAVETTE
jgi:hypothetical protein